MSSVLRGSYRPYIHSSTFNAVTTYNHSARTTEFEKITQAVSPNAFYDSDNRPDPPKCHENTRVAVIDKIMEWVTGTIDAHAFILWLYGPAGAGKTAIARTIAALCEARGLLLASFLFFRSDSKRNTMTPLVANIAYCVACVSSCAHERIEAVIEANPLIFSYSVEVQLTKLILEPLRFLADQGCFLYRSFPRLVLIDGLDECLETDAQTDLIRLLSSPMARTFPLKFLIVSRPEAHIKSALSLAGEQTTIPHLGLNDDFQPDEDILRFFTDKFHEIKMYHPNRSHIPPFWPSEQQIKTLVHKASGQFIYASLAVRFANSPRHSPTHRLDIVLGLRPPNHHDLPFAELDTLYAFILSCSIDSGLVQRILGVNDALNGCGSDVARCLLIESVLGLEDGDVRVHLSALSSLLEVKADNGIHFYHSSFMDFLHTRERSTSYFIDDQKSNSLIARWVLGFFTSLGMFPVPSLTRYRLGSCTEQDLKDFKAYNQEGIYKWWQLQLMDLALYLRHSLWTPELECALEGFSLSTYLDWLDHMPCDELWTWHLEFPETFFELSGEQGEEFQQSNQISALAYHVNQEKPELYRHHYAVYLEHDISSIKSPKSSRKKFHLLSTVWFILQKPFASHWMDFPWARLCVTLFGFNSTEVECDYTEEWNLMRDPEKYREEREGCVWILYGDITETKRLVPQPILTQRLAHVAISCIQYLVRRSSNTPAIQDHLLAWAVKSKRSPWLWRQRMQVASTGRKPTLFSPIYSSLRRSRQILLSNGQSKKFYDVRHAFHIWTLDLLYHTLRKAMKSDELIRALSTPFIPSLAPLLFPGRIKRVRKAVNEYLEKFSTASSDTERNIVIAFKDGQPECSKRAFLTRRNTIEKNLKRNIDNMLDVMYGSTGVDPKTIASVVSMFNQVNEVGEEIRRGKRPRI